MFEEDDRNKLRPVPEDGICDTKDCKTVLVSVGDSSRIECPRCGKHFKEAA